MPWANIRVAPEAIADAIDFCQEDPIGRLAIRSQVAFCRAIPRRPSRCSFQGEEMIMKKVWLLSVFSLLFAAPILYGCSSRVSQDSAREQIQREDAEAPEVEDVGDPEQ